MERLSQVSSLVPESFFEVERPREVLRRPSTVLFVIPPFPARTFSGRTMAPNYLGSLLKRTQRNGRHGVTDWEVLDLDVVPEDVREATLRQRLRSKPYAFVGLSYLSFQADEAMHFVQIADEELKLLGRREKAGHLASIYTPIVAGGRGVTDAEEIATLYPEVDFFVTGKDFHQPLDTIVRIAEVVSSGRTLDPAARQSIPGIVSLDPTTGEVVQTAPNRIPFEQVDQYFRSIKRKDHQTSYDFEIFRDVATGKLRKTAQVYTQLGCGRFCSFCFESLRAQPKSARGLMSVARELIGLSRLGYRGIYFDDSTFTEDRDRALQLMRLMGQLHRRNATVWGFNTRIDALDEKLLATAVQNGCVYTFQGVESMVPAVVEGMGKLAGRNNRHYPAVTTGVEYVERTKEVYRFIREQQLPSAVFLLFGAPKRLTDGTIGTAQQALPTIPRASGQRSGSSNQRIFPSMYCVSSPMQPFHGRHSTHPTAETKPLGEGSTTSAGETQRE